MQRITPVDIQHKTFKKSLQGYDRAEVDHFLDELIESLEDEAQEKMEAEKEIGSLVERTDEAKREYQRSRDNAEKARSELRSLLMTHLSLLERVAPSPVTLNGIAELPDQHTLVQ